MFENRVMCYDEVRDVVQSLGILTAAEVDEQQRLLRALPPGPLPPGPLPAVWGVFRVTGVA